MLPEIGATEWMVIAAVVLIVVGPKDLPVLMRKVGQFVGRLRSMANEFRSSFDEMARQSELDDLRKEVAAMRAGVSPMSMSTVDDGQVSKVFEDIDASLHDRTLYDSTASADYVSPDTPIEPSAEAPAKAKRVRKAPVAAEAAEPAPAPAARKRAAAKPAAPAETKPATAAKPRKTTTKAKA